MPPSLLAGDVEKADQYFLIWTFLKTLNIRTCGQDDPGVTWLELFALFEMMGDLTSKKIRNSAIARCSLRALLLTFKKLTRSVAEMALHIGDLQLFKPSLAKAARLAKIGFFGHQPAL